MKTLNGAAPAIGDCGSDPQQRPDPAPKNHSPVFQPGDHCILLARVGTGTVLRPAGPGDPGDPGCYQCWIEPRDGKPGAVSVLPGSELMAKHDRTRLQALRAIPLDQVSPEVADQVRLAIREVQGLNPAPAAEAARVLADQAHLLVVRVEQSILGFLALSKTPTEAHEARLMSHEARLCHERLERLMEKLTKVRDAKPHGAPKAPNPGVVPRDAYAGTERRARSR